ncbi:MAG TPA: NAD(P)/FAD-dependent oxidoreductase, partial [Spirochaetota bacterium]|nr:NAD(P)/FAD-dependent oxidoreductase [Spirochaetota bacterium]
LSVHRAEQGDGKIFPLAGGAALIRDVLVREFLEHKGEFHGQEGVQKIEKTGCGFVITTNSHNSSREYDAVICATGGYTWPKTGSTGDGYRFARELGHTIVPSVPALTAIICPEEEIRGMSGVALRDVRVRIERAGMLLDVERAGDVLFTHRGLSGPAILDASYAMQRGDHVLIRCLDDERAAAMESGILE